VARLIEDRSEDAEALAAVNTIVVGSERLEGHNTDAPGFERFLAEDAGFEAAGRRALLFGAGGAARACALALARARIGSIVVALREPARVSELAVVVEPFGVQVEVVSFDDAGARAADVIVNATPLGAHGEALPLPRLSPDTVAIDLLYRPATTPLQAAVRAAGGAAFGGLGLLLRQAALSFELWTGRPAPIEVMSAAALAALGEDVGGGRSAPADD
jgi:shikimate dehydrogenase